MDGSPLACVYCHAALPPAAVDRQREIASCPACGRLNDVRIQLRAQLQAAAAQAYGGVAQAPSPAAQPQPAAGPLLRARPPVELPPGMSFEGGGLFGVQTAQSPVTIRRRWLRGKHWIFLLLCAGVSVGVVLLWQAHGLGVWTVLATLFVLSWDYNVTAMFVNSTTIRADASGVDVRHGPIPSLFGMGRRLTRDQIKQLFAANFGSLFLVKAQLVDGQEIDLVKPLVSAEQALFVEQQLEKALGLADYAVDGELGSSARQTIDGKPVAGGGSGAALGLLIPVFIGGMLAFFYFATKSEVSGMLQASPPVGAWTFQADDCESGQLEGFAGVTLTSSQHSGAAVRLIKDPVKGTLAVVDAHNVKKVFEAKECPVFLIHVERTNTSVNDVWGMQGTVTLDCPGLRGAVSFAGCY